MIVQDLFARLPSRYVAEPRVQLGAEFEFDTAASDTDLPTAVVEEGVGDGTPTPGWVPPQPTLDVETGLLDQDEYEVRIYDLERQHRLVAALEFVSPSNKDRPEKRRILVTKCAALVQQRVCVAIVDLVTTRHFNLYADLLDRLGHTDESLTHAPPTLLAAVCRLVPVGDTWRFRAWNHTLALGQPLPTLPLWLADDFSVPLELEATYEQTCRILRIA
jgi:hypothetical protein